MEGRLFPIRLLQFVTNSPLSGLLQFVTNSLLSGLLQFVSNSPLSGLLHFLCFLNKECRVEHFLGRVFKVLELRVDSEAFRVFIFVEYYFYNY